MPLTRIKSHWGNSKQSIAAGALSNRVFPEDLMLCILTRLPVISIHRFKSVCKPWRKTFSSPEFRKMHRAQFSQNPENHSIVIHGRAANSGHTTSLLKIDSDGKTKLTKLDFPFNQISCSDKFVGCCNGLLCVASPCGQLIVLWNPALNNMCKFLPLPDLGIGDPVSVSLGFGYNEEADDFMVVRIVALGKRSVGVEVYSANSDSWTTMEQGFQFTVCRTRNQVIVNGNPYWVAVVDEKEALVCFDVRQMVFKIVPLPGIDFEEVDAFLLVDWKSNLGALVSNKKNKERVLWLDIWIFDDVGKTGWTKNHSFETIELGIFLQCFKNGKFLVGEGYGEGAKVFVFDTETGGVKEIEVDEAKKWSLDMYAYTQSLGLAHIK